MWDLAESDTILAISREWWYKYGVKAIYQAPVFERSGASLTAFVRKEKSFDWNWHYHPEIELTWIRHGHGRRLVGDHAAHYRAGDLVLLGGNLPHTWISAGESRRNEAVVVQFQAPPPELLGLPEFLDVARLLGSAGAGLQFPNAKPVEDLLRGLVKEKGLAAWLRMAEILGRLATAKESEALASSRYRHDRSQKLASRMGRVIEFIEKNFREDIALADAAGVAGLTESAFSRLFSRITNQTFVSYRNACRVREACRALIETDDQVIRIAGECGFENLANFNRRFRERQGMTPREYRRLHERPPR